MAVVQRQPRIQFPGIHHCRHVFHIGHFPLVPVRFALVFQSGVSTAIVQPRQGCQSDAEVASCHRPPDDGDGQCDIACHHLGVPLGIAAVDDGKVHDVFILCLGKGHVGFVEVVHIRCVSYSQTELEMTGA